MTNLTCGKCKGTGTYEWTVVVHGRTEPRKGKCYTCRGTGHPTDEDIERTARYWDRRAASETLSDLRRARPPIEGTATVVKLKAKAWAVDLGLGARTLRYETTFTTKREAQQYAQRFQNFLASGREPSPAHWTEVA